MKKLLIWSAFSFLISCDKGNKNPEPYMVVKIYERTDYAGMKCNTVILKNSFLKYEAMECNNTLKIGDTVLIGRNEAGEYMVAGQNLRNFKIRPLSPQEVQ
jgi:hypothetical protein